MSPSARAPTLAKIYIPVYVNCMSHISIRNLQKMSGAAIEALPGPTVVKSGNRTVGMLIPVKKTDMVKIEKALAMAAKLAIGRDPVADDAALAPFGEVDPTDWSDEANIRAARRKL